MIAPAGLCWKAAAGWFGQKVWILRKLLYGMDEIEAMEFLLDKMKANPEYGIAAVLDADDLHKRGGFATASFLVDFKDGYAIGNKLAGPIVEDASGTGTHGYLPSHPELRSTFMIKGKGIAAARDLHVIDMRQLAPTFANLLHVTLPAAKMQPVNLKP